MKEMMEELQLTGQKKSVLEQRQEVGVRRSVSQLLAEAFEHTRRTLRVQVNLLTNPTPSLVQIIEEFYF